MGFPGLDHFGSTPIISSMKVLCILALAVAVSAEADPQLLYKSLLPTTYVQQPLVYKQPAVVYKQQQVVYKQPAMVQPLVYKQAVPAVIPKYHSVSPGVSHTVLKREAEAEPNHHIMTYGMPAVQPLVYKQAIQPVVYKTPVMQPVVYNAPLAVKSYANDAVKPQEYASKGKYVAETAGSIHIAKREAEAEAEPWTVYGGAYQMPVTTYAHQPVVYKAPVAVATPVVYKAQPVNYAPGSYSNDAVKPFGYAAKGKYIANSAGTVHIAKREAEAEADPALLYGAGLHTPYTYGLNYNTFGYNAYPYTTAYSHFGYGKREAEAEPEAEPWTV